MPSHIILYMLLEIVSFVWAISQDSDDGGGFLRITDRDIAIVVWIVFTILFTLIYGGIFWW